MSGVRPLLARSVLRNGREGVQFSDRRAVKAQKLIAASALLAARQAAGTDLGVLAYLWTRTGTRRPSGGSSARRTSRAAGPATRTRDTAAIELDLRKLAAGASGNTEEEMREWSRLHELRLEAEDDHPGDDDAPQRDQGGVDGRGWPR